MVSKCVESFDRATEPTWHTGFTDLLPALRDPINYEFRRLPLEAREDAIADALAGAAVTYARLHSQGRADIAYPTPLAKYAARHYRAGRRVGGALNTNDI